MPWLFSYGSNHPEQLSERLGRRDLELQQARLVDYWRVFRGYSARWQGGVASVEPSPGFSVYGFIAHVTAADLATLDRYEGVPRSYRRLTVQVEVPGSYSRGTHGEALSAYRRGARGAVPGGTVQAVVYVSQSREFNPPSREYLEAVARTISVFWRSSTGAPVRWSDIPVR
jgi:gamma-glutamylcyclotransferase (GGCT)/AIG2-like uncharacterized protein YtfP